MKVAALGDLHVREHPRGAYRELFTKLSEQVEAILLCGDLTDMGLPEEARALAEDLAALRVPVLAIPGNHDYHSNKYQSVQQILLKAGVLFIDNEPKVIGEVGFVGVKGFGGGFKTNMLDSFGEEIWKSVAAEALREALRLERLLHAVGTKKTIVALHYSPIEETVVGEAKEIYPFLGSSRLAETIDRFNVSAVVHGHAHHGAHRGTTAGGIAVYNVAREVLAKEQKEYLLLEI